MSRKRAALASASAIIAAAGFAVVTAPSSQASSCSELPGVCLFGPPPNDTYFTTLPCTPAKSWAYGGLLGAVQNFCSTRVWLHQNNNGSGWTLCISPSYFVDTNYNGAIANVQITSNKSNC